MVDETKEVHKDAPAEETVDIGVSINASWQRRGYTSLNGVTTVISIDSAKVTMILGNVTIIVLSIMLDLLVLRNVKEPKRYLKDL